MHVLSLLLINIQGTYKIFNTNSIEIKHLIKKLAGFCVNHFIRYCRNTVGNV